jgi:hypothetical protein
MSGLLLDRASAARDKVHDERDHGKEQEQMDKQTGGFKHHETAKPHDNENYCEYEKH